MPLMNDIEDIKIGLRAGRFKNEAAVSQGIILRLLNSLGWPIFDSSTVLPQYAVGSRRVDYALCHPPTKPIILVESKDVGNAVGAEKQLFEYAFHQGIPMAILTDGQEWSFFLPGEQGSYHERCVYKLDLLVRDTDECCRIFARYLQHSEVASGVAINNAKSDYRNISKLRQIEMALPQAWSQLIKEQDELLVELIADKAETLCGFKPEPDAVRKYLDTLLRPQIPPGTTRSGPPPRPPEPTVPVPTEPEADFTGFIFQNKQFPEGSAIGALFRVFELFHQRDASFLDRLAAVPKHGRKRRYLSQNKMDLYPGRPDLCEQYSKQIVGSWWVGTNYSRSTIRHAIELACEIAGIGFGSDLKLI